jgi:photosystem II stability/assembly factor-like uncharacterized protein
MAGKKRKRRTTARDAQRETRIFRKDFGKVRPKRIEPGVVGRARWFSERLGDKADARSTRRLRVALRAVENLAELPDPRDRLREEALEHLSRLATRGKRLSAPLLITARGAARELKTKRLRKREGLSALTHPIQVPEVKGDAFLVIPVPTSAPQYLDLDEIVGADFSDQRAPRLTSPFAYLPNEGVVVGRVNRAGLYQAFAFPKHPWLRLAYDVLCRHWKHVLLDPVVRKLTKTPVGRIGLVDRICQLILCAGDFASIRDPRVFTRGGLMFPPGYEGGDPDLPLGPGIPPGIDGPGGIGGDICERCLGGFLGDIDVFDGVIVAHPLIKWCWIRRPRCSKWFSIGPVPGTDFGGIGRVTQLAIHPTDSNVLLAAAAGGGVWRTNNGGLTWRALMDLQPTLTMGAVAFAPSNPQVVYAGSGEDADGYNPAWGGVGIYRSVDGGTHWSIGGTVPSTLFSAIVVHPTDPDTLYVAGDQGLHKSDDGGATWITNPGLTSLLDAQVTDVVIAHDDPDRLYVGVRSDGVYETTSGGEQVGMSPAFTRLDGASQLPSGAGAGWPKLAIGRAGANGSNCVVAKLGDSGSRIFRTQDGGATWVELAANVAAVSFDEWSSVIAVDPTDEDVMYAGNNSGMMRTTNGGAAIGDWTSVSTGLHADQQDLVFDPNNASRIFLANDGGVYRSADQGTTWAFTSGNLAITQLYDIDIAERDRDIVGGGAQDNGVYYRDAAGVWHHIPWGDGTQFAIDQTDPSIFYFSSQNGLPTYIRKSIDGGASHSQIGQTGLSGGSPWVTIIRLDPTDPIADPANNRTLFVCGTNQLFRSTDGGANWQRVNDAGGSAFQATGTITALEFAPSDPTVLYLGSSTGALYRGVNGGASAADWTRLDTVGSSADLLFPNAQIQSLSVNPLNEDDVWVIFGGAGVGFTGRPGMILNPLGISHCFRSTDAGANWVDASGAFAPMNLPDVPTSAIAISDFDSEVAYVGTDVGVFRTVDGGTTWTAFQDGLARSPVTELKFNRRHNRLFAATMGRGVFVRDV